MINLFFMIHCSLSILKSKLHDYMYTVVVWNEWCTYYIFQLMFGASPGFLSKMLIYLFYLINRSPLTLSVVLNHLTVANQWKITVFFTLLMSLEISQWLPRVHLDMPVPLMSFQQVNNHPFIRKQLNHLFYVV